jgi:geranylgeranyl diphosphate synthase type I
MLSLEEQLVSFFKNKKKAAQAIDPSCLPLVEQIADLTLRPSKRMRPYLVGLGYGKKTRIPHTLLSAMLAVELFHSFALIHDDIMDEDDQRRGGPTVHVQVGISLAILAGDLALVWADELMNKTHHEKAIRLFSTMKEEVAFGQALDVMHQSGYKNIAQDKINELKTAWYSVVRPLQIGAVLAGADQDHLNGLADFGVPVGKLYQLKDDLMDKEITQKEFDQKILPLQKEAQDALDLLDAPQETKTSLADLARFVIERTT